MKQVSPQRASVKNQTAPQATVSSAHGADSALGTYTAESRHTLIALEAYRLAQARGFAPGCELDDWLAAETAVDARLRAMPQNRAL